MGANSGTKTVAFLSGYDRNLYCLSAMAAMEARKIKITCVCILSTSVHEIKRRITQLGFKGFFERLRQKVFGASRKGTEGWLLARFLQHLGISERKVSQFCDRRGIPYIFCKNINTYECVNFVLSHTPDVLIYAGGGLLRDHMLTAARKGALNAHLGELPSFKGTNSVEWSLAFGVQPAVTVHVMFTKLDAGPILMIKPIRCASSIAQTKSRALLAAVLSLAEVTSCIDSYLSHAKHIQKSGKMFYRMHPLMKEILDMWLLNWGRQGQCI